MPRFAHGLQGRMPSHYEHFVCVSRGKCALMLVLGYLDLPDSTRLASGPDLLSFRANCLDRSCFRRHLRPLGDVLWGTFEVYPGTFGSCTAREVRYRLYIRSKTTTDFVLRRLALVVARRRSTEAGSLRAEYSPERSDTSLPRVRFPKAAQPSIDLAAELLTRNRHTPALPSLTLQTHKGRLLAVAKSRTYLTV